MENKEEKKKATKLMVARILSAKDQMFIAVDKEEFEDAARFRDQIREDQRTLVAILSGSPDLDLNPRYLYA